MEVLQTDNVSDKHVVCGYVCLRVCLWSDACSVIMRSCLSVHSVKRWLLFTSNHEEHKSLITIHRCCPCFQCTDLSGGAMCFTLCSAALVLLSVGDSPRLMRSFDGCQDNLPLGWKSNVWALLDHSCGIYMKYETFLTPSVTVNTSRFSSFVSNLSHL